MIVETSQCSSYCRGEDYKDLEISQRSSTSRTLFSEESSDTEPQEDSVSSSSQQSTGIPTVVCELPIPEVTPSQPNHHQQQQRSPPYYNHYPARIISESSTTTHRSLLRSRRSSEISASTTTGRQQKHRSRMRRTSSAVLTTAAVEASHQKYHHHHHQRSQSVVVVAATATGRSGDPLLFNSSSSSSSSGEDEAEQVSVDRTSRRKLRRRRKSSRLLEQQQQSKKKKKILPIRHFAWIWLAVGLCSISLTLLSSRNMMLLLSEQQDQEQLDDEHDGTLLLQSNAKDKNINVLFRQLEDIEQPNALEARPSAGLRGNMLHEVVIQMEKQMPTTAKKQQKEKKKDETAHRHKHRPERKNKKKKEKKHGHGEDKKEKHREKQENIKEPAEDAPVHEAAGPILQPSTSSRRQIILPTEKLEGTPELTFDEQDPRFYRADKKVERVDYDPRIALMDSSGFGSLPRPRQVELDPADFTDNTQFYSILDSNDERVSSTMERRPPLEDGECVPMQDWQKTFHPSCNDMHELDMVNIGEENGDDLKLFGTKGYWRNAWRVDSLGGHIELDKRDTIVLKTLK